MKRAITILLALSMAAVLFCSCGRHEGNKPDAYDGRYVCEQGYFAFIDDNHNVVVQTDEEKQVITDSADIVKIAGGDADLIMLKKDGTLASYVPESKYWISQRDLDSIGTEGNRMEQVWKLVLSASNVEDIAYNGYDYLAVKVKGEWKDGENNSRCNPWNEQQLTKIVFDYTGHYEIGLKKDGTVWVSNEDFFDVDDYVGKSKRIVDIDCAFSPFLLYEDGTVESIEKSPYYAGNVTKWEKVCQITVDAYVSAALTEDGRVLVYAPQNNELLKAAEWKNIRYIKACEDYLLGVDADGNVMVAGN